MLADKLIERKLVESISDETVQRTLKKMSLNRGRKSSDALSRQRRILFGAWNKSWPCTPMG
jgi:hypothetical protein